VPYLTKGSKARAGVDCEVLNESHVWQLPMAGVSPAVDVDYLAGYLTCSR
jgi:hypothetical protein